MSIFHYLSSAVLKKIKKNPVSDSSKILGGATNSEAEQNHVDSYYHS
ncbi:hypothetical protein IMCC3317_16810 [Kordia antarctica]|uniref:Uncharacterized protein n=1 Tax=Kordia antarctica TaxID=1218801 RepID=A0A7L4ZIS1_9FLAO|nr:hypothetical protein [Kordia antarctica]QHI36319.1 hypothetical protein IMCC3317_16810 [Kordia antarctica]